MTQYAGCLAVAGFHTGAISRTEDTGSPIEFIAIALPSFCDMQSASEIAGEPACGADGEARICPRATPAKQNSAMPYAKMNGRQCNIF